MTNELTLMQAKELIARDSKYITLLEDTIYNLVVSEGMHVPEGLEYIFFIRDKNIL